MASVSMRFPFFVWLLPPLLSSSRFSVCLVQLLFSTSLGYFMLLCCTAAAATAVVFCCFFLGYLPSFLRHQWQHLGAAKLAVFFARFLFVQLNSLTRSLLLELCWCTYYLPTYLCLFLYHSFRPLAFRVLEGSSSHEIFLSSAPHWLWSGVTV